ncbi:MULTISPECIES: GIY-YIG nuclease family protein [unclassified Sedimentibacter]|uniref:GIY-YIG nuclease family protein n=1 Tax=unclassified Sedimentibacter TaxID=2649220 RepID=UPI001BD2871C|nr:GIY-YIG nuclease family protein [Sedimentibacter sp. MB35-C1]WMJ77615.1 GIY-YIG nuclease family protein [Sedimentibacter sp. MB35-C1]
MHYIYIVECSDKTLYTGYTTDVEKRIKTHNDKKGAKYTRGRTPVVLKYSEQFDNKVDAMKREAQIKNMNREKKLKLLNSSKI